MTMTSSVGSSIISALGAGSGLNTDSIVSQLVSVVRAPQQSLITTNQTLNSSRISGIASAVSSLDTFSSSLTSLLKDTAYSGKPASSDTTIASVSAMSGGTPSGLPATIEVQQLAQAQVLKSETLASGAAVAGQGTLTLTTASGAHTITIDPAANTMADLAKAINSANAGVTASVMTDSSGSRLVLKGANGATNGFTLTKEATDTADANLERFTFGGASSNGTMTQTQAAQNALVSLDGIQMEYTDNVITDAIPYVRIDLNKAAPGTTVTLATDQPTSSMTDLLKDFVSAFNTLRSALNDASKVGKTADQSASLVNDSSIRDMKTRLGKLTTTTLSDDPVYNTLSSIGVSTNLDGTLSLNTDKLAKVLQENPEAVTKMINPTTSTAANPGLAKAVSDVKDALEGTNGPLTLAKERYENLAKDYTKQMDALDKKMTDYEERMTTLYSALGSQLTALKATQSYLQQQIDSWNSSSSKG